MHRVVSSLGAVNGRTRSLTQFDTTERRLGPKHFMASAALPWGLPGRLEGCALAERTCQNLTSFAENKKDKKGSIGAWWALTVNR